MSLSDVKVLSLAREYVQLSRDIKHKKSRMKVLLAQLGHWVVKGVPVPELGVRLVQHNGRYRSYPTQAFHDRLGVDALLACTDIDPIKVDEYLNQLPPSRRPEVERQLSDILKVTLKPRHVVESLQVTPALASS